MRREENVRITTVTETYDPPGGAFLGVSVRREDGAVQETGKTPVVQVKEEITIWVVQGSGGRRELCLDRATAHQLHEILGRLNV